MSGSYSSCHYNSRQCEWWKKRVKTGDTFVATDRQHFKEHALLECQKEQQGSGQAATGYLVICRNHRYFLAKYGYLHFLVWKLANSYIGRFWQQFQPLYIELDCINNLQQYYLSLKIFTISHLKILEQRNVYIATNQQL